LEFPKLLTTSSKCDLIFDLHQMCIYQ
jgi:hypothetical protein